MVAKEPGLMDMLEAQNTLVSILNPTVLNWYPDALLDSWVHVVRWLLTTVLICSPFSPCLGEAQIKQTPANQAINCPTLKTVFFTDLHLPAAFYVPRQPNVSHDLY